MGDPGASVEGYIDACADDVQPILREIRRRMAAVLPGSGEKISYRMPTVTVDGTSLLYYAAWAKHIGIYPIPPLEPELEREVAPFRSGRDSVRFPLRHPVPYDLIDRLAVDLAARR